MTGTAILAAICLLLSAGLSWALGELYRIRAREVGAKGSSAPGAPKEKIEELTTMLLALQKYGMSKTGSVPREEFCDLFLEHACRLMNSSAGSVALFDDEKELLTVLAARKPPSWENADQALEKGSQFRPGTDSAGRAFKESRPALALQRREGGPFLAVPMMLQAKTLGVLSLYDTGGSIVPDELFTKFLTLLAAEAAAVLNHQQMVDELQTFYLEMIETLARAVDAKDSYSQDHSQKLRKWAREIALELGLPGQMVRYVEFATMLHSVGKIGVDQAILSKPGKLTPEEFEQVKKHTAIGHRILAPVRFLGPVAQMVLYHQEWYNGKGYPEGLKGEEIPLGSRIVAVVNAWEAMNSDRPYRKALDREVAVAELKKGAGAQFDPGVVEAFLRVEEKSRSVDRTA